MKQQPLNIEHAMQLTFFLGMYRMLETVGCTCYKATHRPTDQTFSCRTMDDKTTQPSSDTHIGDSHLPNRARARVHAHGSQEGARAKKVKQILHLYFTTPIEAFSLVRKRKKGEEEEKNTCKSKRFKLTNFKRQ